MNVLLIDNYDSFTFNLYQYVGEILTGKKEQFTLDVLRNNEITLLEIKKRNYDRIIISPGPGNPRDTAYFGVCSDVIRELGRKIPILGVCLGMQGIAFVYGGTIIPAQKPMHGKSSMIVHDGSGVFHGLPSELEVMRYHSLIVEKASLPECLEISAMTKNEEQEIMGLRHKVYPIEGVQFHPESFATEGGKKMLENFLMNTNKPTDETFY
jgi:anthranilate synthase/aminodeoxychorismate synthase-like glutamine amidotransferase